MPAARPHHKNQNTTRTMHSGRQILCQVKGHPDPDSSPLVRCDESMRASCAARPRLDTGNIGCAIKFSSRSLSVQRKG